MASDQFDVDKLEYAANADHNFLDNRASQARQLIWNVLEAEGSADFRSSSRATLTVDIDDAGQAVVIGKSRFFPEKLASFLRSFQGTPLIIEYKPASGELKSAPDWFIEKVLKPTGYTDLLPAPVE